MNLVRSLAQFVEKRFSLGDLDRLMDLALVGMPTASGVPVNEYNALNLSAFWACVNSISQDMSSMPLHTYRRLEDGGKEIARNHYLYPILHDWANPEMTARDFREIMQAHVLTWGNAYAMIDWDKSDRVKGLYPLCPDRMEVERKNAGEPITYTYRDPKGQKVPIPNEYVFHLRGLGFDGVKGYSVVGMMRQTLGGAMAAEQYASTLYKNGVRASGVIEVPTELGDVAYNRLKQNFDEAYAGLSNAGKAILMEGGAKFTPISISPDDAQFLETRGLLVEEIARYFRMPGVMIGHPDKTATYASAEQFFLSYVKFCLLPWCDKWEKAIGMSLLGRSRTHFVEHSVEGLLRGDTKSRAEYLKTMVDAGLMMPNEARGKENMNPVKGGDVFYRPLNTAYLQPDGTLMIPAQPKSEPKDESVARMLEIANRNNPKPHVNGLPAPALEERPV